MAYDFILDSDEHGEFCVIPLCDHKGNVINHAEIDTEDFEDISKYKWHEWKVKGCKTVYAARSTENGSTIKMHQQILKVQGKAFVDHADGNGLRNRKYNLRVATRSQNQWNRSKNINGKSKFKGVSRHRKNWQVFIKYLGKSIYLGEFKPEIVNGIDIGEIRAAKAYDKAARKYFGVFARLNFPEGEYMGYIQDQKVEQEALKLIAECKSEKLDVVAMILSYKTVSELEIMCKYLGCNISELAGRVLSFSKGLSPSEQ
jgi:hypothetical protein